MPVPPDAESPDPGREAVPTVGDVLRFLEDRWPSSLAEPWDAVGLVAGRQGNPAGTILLAVDATEETVAEAVDAGAGLLLAHHPLLMRGVTSVADTSYKGAVVQTLIENGVALATAHTNADSGADGVSDALARAAGLDDDLRPLVPRGDDPRLGLGRVGRLARPATVDEVAQRLRQALPATAHGLRISGGPGTEVSTVAVCGGAGDSLFDAVRAAGADLYVTADLRHHAAQEARQNPERRPALIDLSHFASEWLWLPTAARLLEEHFGDRVRVVVSEINTDPWSYRL